MTTSLWARNEHIGKKASSTLCQLMFRNVGTSEYTSQWQCGEDATDELYNKVRSVSEGKLSPYVRVVPSRHTLRSFIYSDVGIPYLLVNLYRHSYSLETLTSQMWEPTLSFLYVGTIGYQPQPEQGFTGYHFLPIEES